MPTNTAAYLPETNHPIEVREAPYPTPQESELVIRARALAINPCDWAAQQLGPALFPYIKFPFIVGEDIAGEVVETGSGITGFKVGDRVLALASSAFQTYAVAKEHMASLIPPTISYEVASVVPLALSTSIISLFHKDYLGLQYPSTNPVPTTKTLLIWGGSTSVGSIAIQAAVAAGYEVISTASPKNFAYVKNLGASLVFDYTSPNIADDLTAAMKGRQCAGGMAIAGVVEGTRNAAAEACSEVLARSEGTKLLALTMPPPPGIHPAVDAKFANAANFHQERELGFAVLRDWLPKALVQGTFVPAPDPVVVGEGLESVQAGLNRLREQGASAQKYVVSLQG